MHVRVKVTSGASREHIIAEEDALWIFVKEQPQDNRANRRVMQIIAERYGVSLSRVRIVAGHHAPRKTLKINE